MASSIQLLRSVNHIQAGPKVKWRTIDTTQPPIRLAATDDDRLTAFRFRTIGGEVYRILGCGYLDEQVIVNPDADPKFRFCVVGEKHQELVCPTAGTQRVEKQGHGNHEVRLPSCRAWDVKVKPYRGDNHRAVMVTISFESLGNEFSRDLTWMQILIPLFQRGKNHSVIIVQALNVAKLVVDSNIARRELLRIAESENNQLAKLPQPSLSILINGVPVYTPRPQGNVVVNVTHDVEPALHAGDEQDGDEQDGDGGNEDGELSTNNESNETGEEHAAAGPPSTP